MTSASKSCGKQPKESWLKWIKHKIKKFYT